MSINIPSRLIEFVGGDSGGADLGFELGVVFRSNMLYPTDLGGYYTASATDGSSLPYTAGLKSPIGKWGLAASLGVYGGDLQDFAGQATFGSVGVVYGGEVVRSDSGVWGGEIYIGGAASASMGRSNTHVVSIRQGFIDSTCENVAC